MEIILGRLYRNKLSRRCNCCSTNPPTFAWIEVGEILFAVDGALSTITTRFLVGDRGIHEFYVFPSTLELVEG